MKSRKEKATDKEVLALSRAIAIAGSQKYLAENIGVTQQAVHVWLTERNKIPAEHIIPIEKSTLGLVKRYELRPDLYPVSEYKIIERHMNKARAKAYDVT
jgi:DNA-binding transcriptional regulator YdaS (Cro superfamily)